MKSNTGKIRRLINEEKIQSKGLGVIIADVLFLNQVVIHFDGS